MKDVQGIQRGKCNQCECEEYRTPPSDAPNKYRCEYCNHTPVDHVRIIKLGKCKKCGECEEYDSEEQNSYTDCQYCGCDASCHQGAEKLRKNVTPVGAQPIPPGAMPSQGGMPPHMMMAQGGHPMMMQPNMPIRPRVDASGKVVQSAMFGTCKLPSCPFPRRVEGGKVYDFCSKTCSQKFASESGSAGGPATGPPTTYGPTGGPPPRPPAPPGAGPGGPSMMGGKLCSNCKQKAANPGRGWCEQCYQMKSKKF